MPNGPSGLRDTLLISALLAVAASAVYLGHAIHRAAKVADPLTDEMAQIGEEFDATSGRLQPAIDAIPGALENLSAIREQVPSLLRFSRTPVKILSSFVGLRAFRRFVSMGDVLPLRFGGGGVRALVAPILCLNVSCARCPRTYKRRCQRRATSVRMRRQTPVYRVE